MSHHRDFKDKRMLMWHSIPDDWQQLLLKIIELNRLPPSEGVVDAESRHRLMESFVTQLGGHVAVYFEEVTEEILRAVEGPKNGA